MISFILSLSLILEPLLPANIPPNWIYMGAGLKPIQAVKIDRGFEIKEPSALLTIHDFIRLKSAFENSPDLCTYAIDEALKECRKGTEKQLSIAFSREQDDKLIIQAYEARLDKTEKALIDAQEQSKIYKYSTLGFGAVALSSLTALIIWSK